MRIETVAPDIHIAIGETYESNSTIFLNGREALLIDAMGSASDAAELQRHVENALGARVRFIISTHYFSDHMAALARFPGATIIAHELSASTFASEQHRSDEETSFFIEPGLTFSDRLTLRWGAHTLELFHNPGHTMSTIGVDVADADLLFTGDTAVGNIAYVVYTTPELVAQALERLRDRGRHRIIASHGGMRDAVALDHALAYVRALQAGSADEPPEEFERVFHRRNLEHLAANQISRRPSSAFDIVT
jgi:glyoxylase-like metal-dependent hydrolase (beta-lactamase superfamily II)